MNFILLSGNSVRAKEWIHNLRDSVVMKFGNTYIHNYKHWDTGEDMINFDVELNSLSEKLNNPSPYIFIAKSAGCILALKSMSKETTKPTACLFLGLPIKFAKLYSTPLSDLLIKTDVPIIIAQNDNDPFGSYDEIENIVKSLGNKNITVKKLDGNTHDYDNFGEISHILSNIV